MLFQFALAKTKVAQERSGGIVISGRIYVDFSTLSMGKAFQFLVFLYLFVLQNSVRKIGADE